MKFVFLFYFSFLLIHCSPSKKSIVNPEVSKQDSVITSPNENSTIRNISKFPDIKNQNNLSVIMKELNNAECVNENGIGFAGEYTRTFALFERMKQLATETQLNSFLKHKNPVVRVYAFRALKDLKYLSANKAKQLLDSDSTSVCWFSGCLKTTVPVYTFSYSEE